MSPPDLVAAAHSANTFVEYERAALAVVQRAVGADVAFMVRGEGLGAGALGIRSDVALASRRRWPVYGSELSGVFEEARARGGVAIDAEVLGSAFGRTRVFREFIAPHDGRCTLIGIVALGDDVLATVAAGRTQGTYGDRERAALGTLLPTLAVCDAAMLRRSEAWAGFTSRERDVVRGLRLGYTNREIAVSLGTSVNTVRNQMQSIFRKLGATTRAEAVALSFGHGR